jgi:hypothetical protein
MLQTKHRFSRNQALFRDHDFQASGCTPATQSLPQVEFRVAVSVPFTLQVAEREEA